MQQTQTETMRELSSVLVRRVCCGLMALIIGQMQVFGAFHLWELSEVYSNGDGSVQFIEMSCAFGSQNFIGDHRIIARDGNGVVRSTFTIPNDVVGNTLNKYLLFATPGFASLPGGIVPDFAISNNFLSLINGSVSFESVDTLTYQSLPADGVQSIHSTPGGAQTVAVNSPRNFAGQAGSIQPSPRLSIQRPQTNVVWISFMSAADRTYGLERTRVLTGAWETVSTITGDGTLKRYTNALTLSGDRAFYRLRQN